MRRGRQPLDGKWPVGIVVSIVTGAAGPGGRGRVDERATHRAVDAMPPDTIRVSLSDNSTAISGRSVIWVRMGVGFSNTLLNVVSLLGLLFVLREANRGTSRRAGLALNKTAESVDGMKRRRVNFRGSIARAHAPNERVAFSQDGKLTLMDEV